MKSVSLNEIEVTLRKAAIGMGLPLGIAEDTALAATWLAARGYPGIDLYHTALQHAVDHNGTARTLEREPGALVAKGPVAALWFGPAAVDHLCLGARQGVPAEIRADWIDYPLLCFAMLAVAAAEYDLRIAITWKRNDQTDAIARCYDEKVSIAGTLSIGPGPLIMSLVAPSIADPPIARDDFKARLARSLAQGVMVDEQLWAKISQLAARTLVPASETSRLSGAGAGILDND